ncbi:methyltransferase type 11 [Xylariaceae sp. AK1471]|nr:methyltransferase type 11 [Xylariaceae sp. AK1471]
MSSKIRLASVLRLSGLIWLSVRLHWDAFKEALRKDGLAAFTHPQQIRDAAVAKLFSITSDGFVAYENTTIVPSLVKAAQGRILELGPGPGNQIHRYDPFLVDFIYAIDPNPHFEDDIAAKLKKHDLLEDKYKLLVCGVEDSEILRREGIAEGSMDSVTSIQVMCAVGDVKSVMKEVYRLLKPGGRFVFWEHGKSKNTVTAVAQACWNPAWYTFVGCSMTRDIRADILAAGEWENPGDIKEADEPYSCLPRIWGVLIKKA